MISCLKIVLLLPALIGWQSASQALATRQDSLKTYSTQFRELQLQTQQHRQLWNLDLYSSILLVNPVTREVIANEPSPSLSPTSVAGIYRGALPDDMNIANTALEWDGKAWAMVLLPLAENKEDRINLLAHELFHKVQSALGFEANNPANNHLDEKEGRIYLRLELEALRLALNEPASSAEHLSHAMAFRRLRHERYPGSASTENLLELNEGLAEYTGMVISGRNSQSQRLHFNKAMDRFLQNPSFVRSFAYQTLPLYGYLLDKSKPGWNLSVSDSTDLTALLSERLSLPPNLEIQDYESPAAEYYDSKRIIAEESSREAKRQELLAHYQKIFVQDPHLRIPFEQMSVSFDPRNVFPFGSLGSIYPTLRVTDNWGILTVTEGALLSSQWDFVIVSAPSQTDTHLLQGAGWTLQLNTGYGVVQEIGSPNFVLEKH